MTFKKTAFLTHLTTGQIHDSGTSTGSITHSITSLGDAGASLKFSELFINDNAIDTRVGATLQFGGVVTKNGIIIVSTEYHGTLNKSGLLDITNGSAELRIADSIASKSAHDSG